MLVHRLYRLCSGKACAESLGCAGMATRPFDRLARVASSCLCIVRRQILWRMFGHRSGIFDLLHGLSLRYGFVFAQGGT